MEQIICVSGKNDIAVNAVKYLIDELHIDKKNLRIITNKTDDGVDSWQPSFKKFAKDNGIQEVLQKDVFDIENLIFISLEFDRIIKPEKYKTKQIYNMHFSLLPAYKGMYTAVLPLINGETKSGVTFHYIDAGIDTGDIIKQKIYDIELTDTARDIYFKNLKYSFELFKEVIKDVLDNNVKSYPQSNIGASYYSKQSIDFSKIQIDYNKTAFEIYNQLRAFIFPEYQLPKINGKEVYKLELTEEKMPANQLIENEDYFEISGIDYYKVIAYKK